MLVSALKIVSVNHYVWNQWRRWGGGGRQGRHSPRGGKMNGGMNDILL
jgi:hypothetical protein